MNTLKDLLKTDKNPIAHYRDIHTIVNLINYLPTNLQYEVASRMLKTDLLEHNNIDSREFLKDSLAIFLDYRNLAAHGGRIYNYTSKCECRSIPTVKGFSLLINIMAIYKFSDPLHMIQNTLTEQVDRHCSLYPEDATYLSNILKVNIESHDYLWLSEKSKIIHSNPFCSGMKNAIKIEISEIQEDYIPCKRCLNI